MSLRINHNLAAVNSHRNLVTNDARLSKTLEHLSSGQKINRGADGPAALVISEQMRGQVAGLTQAIMNSETAVSMVQTTEAALNEMSSLMISMRQLAIHAANEGANDQTMLEADQAELANALNTMDRIARTSQFGRKPLLDGSNGINGITSGEQLAFLGATNKTMPSPASGYQVTIDQEATQARTQGTVALTQNMIDLGETFVIREGGKTVELTTQIGETTEKVQNRINDALRGDGLKLDAYFDEMGMLNLIHKDYGSKANFSVTSSTAGVLSGMSNVPTQVQNGLDVAGRIGGEVCTGDGQVLTGGYGTIVDGLQVRFTGVVDPQNPEVGRVSLESKALTFQVGGNHNQTVSVLLPNLKSDQIAVRVDNESGFNSLRDLDIRSFQGAQDALLLLDEAIDQVTKTRGELGAVQKNTLETNINSLRIAKESMISAESVIRDTDMAEEMSDFTKNQIMTQSATAMLAQANQTPNNVLTLLK